MLHSQSLSSFSRLYTCQLIHYHTHFLRFIRHWDVFVTPGKYAHLMVAPIVNGKIVPESLIDIMGSLAYDSPVPPFGGLEQVDISPDGTSIAFTAGTRQAKGVGEEGCFAHDPAAVDHNSAWNTGWDIFEFHMNSNTTVPVSTGGARATNPRYSPDGSWIAFLYDLTRSSIYILPECFQEDEQAWPRV